MPLPALAVPLMQYGIPAAASFFGSMFAGGGGGNDNNDNDNDWQGLLDETRGQARQSRTAGADMTQQGLQSMQPLLAYLQKLTGGDQTALMEATMPERARVIDQYDSARIAASQFGPRGGGSNSAIAGSYLAQAKDLSSITANARSKAIDTLASVGPAVAGLGLSMQQLASMDLNQVISALLARENLNLQQRGQNMALLGSAGEVAGSIIGAILTRGEDGATTGGTI